MARALHESAPRPGASGWFSDPHAADLERYWSGYQWTSETRPRARKRPDGVVTTAVVVALIVVLVGVGVIAVVGFFAP